MRNGLKSLHRYQTSDNMKTKVSQSKDFADVSWKLAGAGVFFPKNPFDKGRYKADA